MKIICIYALNLKENLEQMLAVYYFIIKIVYSMFSGILYILG